MSWEIERRFLVRVAPGAWEALGDGRPLRQGYVVAGPRTVRIRVGEERGPVLTCKSGSGVRRREVEQSVTEEMAEALFQVAGARVIEKVRHRSGSWEVDRFAGPLTGLALLEIELDAPDAPLPEWPDGVSVLREVTDDNRFTSSGLASLTKEEQEEWVNDVYAEAGG
jgi:adenylate cyclase